MLVQLALNVIILTPHECGDFTALALSSWVDIKMDNF